MPKLPVIKDRELIRALHKLGFQEERHDSTSHAMFKHPDGRRAMVAIHAGRDIPRGTLASLLRRNGITVQQLIDAL